MSRYQPTDFSRNKKGKFMRCIECNGEGHFKCRKQDDSEQVKLSFTVRDDIDEFLAMASQE